MYTITLLPGDGIGPEIVAGAVQVLKAVQERAGVQFVTREALFGGCAYDATGDPFPEETQKLCLEGDAVLLGAVGGPQWDNLAVEKRPEIGALLPLRKLLGAFANLRPSTVFSALADASTLKREVVDGLDIMVVRELTGGIYFGAKYRETLPDGNVKAVDVMEYSTGEIERVARVAFDLARKRNGKVTLVDKANVLESSRLWREVVTSLAGEYPDVELNHILVDNCAMQLVRNPKQFDVMLTENMFGDILSDLASQLTGSIGMLPSASLGGKIGLYEPIHGSAPDIAGQNQANPIATILSVAMMLRYSFDMPETAGLVEQAVAGVLNEGYRTADIMQPGMKQVGTREMAELIGVRLKLS
ncbi:3-isopropylmalate dehydrogenase [Sporotomaculum syntrophicum]|uniref:3-isopropylmalate dehydrogenase n=1 Tax=Sporotomaculum syntrophicum TaxID=182264 RepID=A0A9D2WPP2_9FIRM|nr:3-isopropylmalate dehydrogenase [Sporotomaculum syntrophicum]KAF1085073.1 3-isopropylmalate dehydrogenase [Sporotomaculum syntrophicum]